MIRKIVAVALVNIGFAVVLAVLVRAATPLIAGKLFNAIGAEIPSWISAMRILLTNTHIVVSVALGFLASWCAIWSGTALKRDPSVPLLCMISFALAGSGIGLYFYFIGSRTGIHEGGWEIPALWGVAATIAAPISVAIVETMSQRRS